MFFPDLGSLGYTPTLRVAEERSANARSMSRLTILAAEEFGLLQCASGGRYQRKCRKRQRSQRP